MERTVNAKKVKDMLSDIVCSASILFCMDELPESMLDAIAVNIGKTACDLSEILIGEGEAKEILVLAETKFRKYEHLVDALEEVRKNDLN